MDNSGSFFYGQGLRRQCGDASFLHASIEFISVMPKLTGSIHFRKYAHGGNGRLHWKRDGCGSISVSWLIFPATPRGLSDWHVEVPARPRNQKIGSP
jgi:hypothetical protein